MPQAANLKSVALRFQDGVERLVHVAEDQTILEAALAGGAPVLHQCKSGSCTSCLAQLVEGDAEMRRDAASALLASERQQGARLLCLSKAKTDCAFELDYTSSEAGDGPTNARAFIDEIEYLADDVLALRLELAEGDWLSFKPGQYIQVKVPGTEAWRSYSIATSPAALPKLELLIRLLPNGVMSEFVAGAAKPDSVLELKGPYGSFFLRDWRKGPLVMIAGGTGLAPIMSMLDFVREQPGTKPSILVSFGCATSSGLFYREELELRELWMPSLEVRTSCDAVHSDAQVRRGNPVEAIAGNDITDPDAQAYLCGPPGLVEAARAGLAGLGIAQERIHAEQFRPSE